uniref:NADH-cytochrome b5 reductase n=1 Tax=Haptolina ericina TaxID=156174 RepID=A0A7S3F6A1_9EUKA|mmetsp:Transcript_51915/g.116548  ORF Transcript_51915/g.116548 Transcript_51915/m.116548 type:complete len:334 (+) Transcript_51915:3-1004(+)
MMLLADLALKEDPKCREWVERFAKDQGKFFADFASVWVKMQENGQQGLKPHPHSLSYASSCYLPTDWIELPLVRRVDVNHDSTKYAFGLPTGTSLDLPACACILLKAPGRGRGSGKGDWDGSDAVRPYTPISSNEVTGRFELLVKRYPDGAVSQYLHGLRMGAKVAFRHIKFNIKTQYPFEGVRTISMICAGSGITPIFQALTLIMGRPDDGRQVVLLYGNKAPEDILLKEEIDRWARAAPDRLKVVHVIGNRPDDPHPPGWETTSTYIAETGWIDQAKVTKHCFPPAEDTLVFVCGLPLMYNAICGPRDQKSLREGSVLHTLGYSPEMVAKM